GKKGDEVQVRADELKPVGEFKLKGMLEELKSKTAQAAQSRSVPRYPAKAPEPEAKVAEAKVADAPEAKPDEPVTDEESTRRSRRTK
ncbi:MAG: hypothetical protein ACWGQW_14245, partial [bacterium]